MPRLRARWAAAAEVLNSATPPDRDRAVDALRALAILGVVLGHWLVTSLTTTDGGLSGTSPLAHMGGLAPVSWVFQTLAVFFLVGGHVAARGYASARARGTRTAAGSGSGWGGCSVRSPQCSRCGRSRPGGC